MNKCYKVVRTHNDLLISSTINDDFVIFYEPGKIVEPLLGKIFVFNTVADAKFFLGCYYSKYGYAIYECDCGPLTVIQRAVHCLSTKQFPSFWKETMSPSDFQWYTTPVPFGSLVTPWVRLIKEVG